MSNGGGGPRTAIVASVIALVIGIGGGIASILVNAFVIADSAAYGEVPIPGSASLELPAGDVDISYRATTLTVGGQGVMVPPIQLSIDPPPGVARPHIDDTMSSSTKSNREVTVRVFTVHIQQAGTYRVVAKAPVFESQNPRLAFGHGSPYYWVMWPFFGVALFGGAALAAAIVWAMRSGKRTYPLAPQEFGVPAGWPPSDQPNSYQPTDQAVRLEQLKTIAALRDTGALTEAEFEAEKRRILNS
ncbi:SHOCT domain-containing protein [Mycolicibacterium sp. 050232]|uniref:SHOCT domain-containing protein n=1 Tax=Mycolicibacterium sp. 050232 TaxID=3113982 RepID=UPI002E2ACE11|nr:SHOCT domain-containing protein [Mycolicibacterium sp. 050232]MED5812969.1 SHOCT domain-containing protein [Mycolicibacterium sp. 050232]